MSGITVGIKIDSQSLLERLGKLKVVIDKDFLKAVGWRALQWTNDNFEQEGKLQPTGPWQKLKDSTIARRREGPGSGSPKILQNIGNLKKSFSPYGVKESGRMVTIGTEAPYASYHEEGTEHLPIRKMLPPEEIVQKLAVNIFDALVEQAYGD